MYPDDYISRETTPSKILCPSNGGEFYLFSCNGVQG